MKILHVIDSLNAGGAERVLVDLCNILHEQGTEVGVVCLIKREKLREDLHPAITYFNLDRKFKFSPRKIIAFHRICQNYDIVHVHMRQVLRYVLFCDFIRPLSAQILFHDHFGDIRDNKSVDKFINYRKNRFVYVGVSSELKSWALNHLKKSEQACHVVPNIARRLEIENVPVPFHDRIVLVSNFRRTKNIEFAIAFLAALGKHSKVELDIFGQVIDHRYFTMLQELVINYRLDDRVRLITDTIHVQRELHRYSLAIHTSKSETGPLVLIEYFAQEIPFLAFRTGEVAEQVHSFFPDFFVDHFDIPVWVARFEKLRSISRQCWKDKMAAFYERTFSEDSYYQRWKVLYEQTLNC